jgi:hypothetical protein
MTSSVGLYEALTWATDDRARARVAEAFECLEERYPYLPDLATQAHLRETELRLHKEIAQLRAELSADITEVRNAPRETETRLRQEIAQIRAALHAKEIETVRKEIARITPDVVRVIVPLMLAQVAAIVAVVKVL